MNRNDLSAISQWIDRLIEKMKEGKKVLTSPHELSMRLIKHIENKISTMPDYKLIKNYGMKTNLADLGFIMKDARYSTYQNIELILKHK